MTQMRARTGRKKRPVRAAALIDNPAWDYIKDIPHDSMFAWGQPSQFSPTNSEVIKDRAGNFRDFIGHRSRVTALWTWAIPSPSALDFVAEQSNGRPIVDMGAGNGYWAWCLTQMGCEVIAFDAAPFGTEHAWFGGAIGAEVIDKWLALREEMGEPAFESKEYYPVIAGSTEVLGLAPTTDIDPVLFLCWPTYDSPFAYDAVKAYQGDTVIYIGEGDGGCNADWRFFELMEGTEDSWGSWGKPDEEKSHIVQEWEKVAFHPLIQWSAIHDNITVYKRKKDA